MNKELKSKIENMFPSQYVDDILLLITEAEQALLKRVVGLVENTPETKEEKQEPTRIGGSEFHVFKEPEEGWKKSFINEFGIHFKGSAGELQFALEFISSLLRSEKEKWADK